jgi:hypothetical protein
MVQRIAVLSTTGDGTADPSGKLVVGWKAVVSFQTKRCFFHLCTQKISGVRPSSYEAVTQGLLLGLKEPFCDAPYSFSFNANIQSMVVHLRSTDVLMASYLSRQRIYYYRQQYVNTGQATLQLANLHLLLLFKD